MIEVGTRRRGQPAPPHVLFEALTTPDRDPIRVWLELLPDEQPPLITTTSPTSVTWSGLWSHRPDAVVRFDLAADGYGTDLRWTLLVDEPAPGDSQLGHLRKRIDQLINANLRYSFGQ